MYAEESYLLCYKHYLRFGLLRVLDVSSRFVSFRRKGTLIFLCGGDEALFERVKDTMESTLGKAAHFLGPVGSGSKMKLVVNMTMGTMMNSLVRPHSSFQISPHTFHSSKGLSMIAKRGLRNSPSMQRNHDGSFAWCCFRRRESLLLKLLTFRLTNFLRFLTKARCRIPCSG